MVSCKEGPVPPDEDDDVIVVEPNVNFDEFLDGNIFLNLNPYIYTPLSAEVRFDTKDLTTVQIRVLGEEIVEQSFALASTTHELPVLGLYAGRTNQVEITLTDSNGDIAKDTLEVTTDPLPNFFPTVNIETKKESEMEPGMNLAEFSTGNGGLIESYPFIFDSNGDIRWYLDLNRFNKLLFPIRRLTNGNWIIGDRNRLYEYDMLGKEVNFYFFNGYAQHHEIVEKPNGNLLLCVSKDDIPTEEDFVIEVERNTGHIVREWDLRESLDMYRRDLMNNAVDWFHGNAIAFDPSDNSIIISGRNQGIVKVSQYNELVWILAPHQGWGQAGINADGHDTNDFLLQAIQSDNQPYPNDVQQGLVAANDFDWSWGQHTPMILPNGNLFVLDNGLNRHFLETATYTRGVEYEIDETNMTVKEVWQYGKERGVEYYAPIISDVDYLPETGNYLIIPGLIYQAGYNGAYITEVKPANKEVVFEAEIIFTNKFGTSNGSWGHVDIMYRAERLSLYP